jgi:hypothetical protein
MKHMGLDANLSPVLKPFSGRLHIPVYYKAGQVASETIYYDQVKIGSSYGIVQPG